MGRFGEKLRRERELREITLEEVATATKIGTRSLRALEEEKFDRLPGGVFNRGFVRAYARYVGIDEDEAVMDFLEASKEAEPESKELNKIAVIAKQVESSRAREPGARRRGAMAFACTLLAVLVLAGVALAGWPYLEKWRHENPAQGKLAKLQSLYQQVQAATKTSTPSNAAAPNAVQSGAEIKPAGPVASPVSTESPTAAPASKEISLVVSAKQRSWIEVTADGKVVMRGTIDPDSSNQAERTFTARTQLVLVTGNPNGIELTFNGRPFKIDGPMNRTRSLTFSAAATLQE